MQKSGKFLDELLKQYDHDRDQCLSYNEVKNLISEIGVNIDDETFETILVSQALDVGMKAKKVSFKQLKWYFSFGSEPVTTAPSQQLGKDRKVNKMRGNVSEKQFEDCREASRKIFYGKVNLNDLLKVKDVSKD